MKHKEKNEQSPTGKNSVGEPACAARDDVGQLTFFVEATPVASETAPPVEAQAPALSAPPQAPSPAAAATIDLRPPATRSVRVTESLGQRLAAARETRGWSREDVASKLRLPAQVVHLIESEQYERIGHGVYLRGYLSSYARLVDVPAIAVEQVLRQHASTPELVASGRISHSRYLIDRYSGSALYVVLTGMVVVPFVMFAMNMGSDVGARLTPLDAPAPAATAAADSADTGKTTAGDTAATTTAASASVPAPAAPATSDDSPLMASFTPFPNSPRDITAPATGQLRLTLNEASWVEIVDVDGKRLEYTTLPAGTTRSYASDKPLEVRLGNTSGARLEVNGEMQDIGAYNRGNVAHFKLFAAGKTVSHSD